MRSQTEPLDEPSAVDLADDAVSGEMDALPEFLSEVPVATRGRCRAMTHQPLPRLGSGPAADVPIPDRAVECSLDQLHHDVDALRLHLCQLRSAGAEFAHQYASLGDLCHLAETREVLATDALREIESRLGLLEATWHLANSAGDRLTALSQLSNEIGRVATDFQAHKQSLDRGLVEASRMTELLALFDAGARTVNDHAVWETVRHLEQRVTAAIAALDRRLDSFEEHTHLITEAVVEATRATAVVSSLDARIAALTGLVMDRTGKAVGQLVDQRVAMGVPGGALRTTSNEHALAHLPTPSPTLTESARIDRDTPEGRRERSDIPQPSAVPRSPMLRERLASVTLWLRAKKPTNTLRWAAGLVAVAVIGLLGTAGIRARHRPVESVDTAQVVHRDSNVTALPSEVSSKALVSQPFTRPTRNPSERRSVELSGTSDTRPMTSNPAPPTMGLRAGRSDSPTSRAILQPVSDSATNASPPFRGTLSIESVPSRAAVFMNQKRIGETPLRLEHLRAGSQVIWIERNGYERWSTSVLVAADQHTRLSVKLQPVRDR